MLFTLQDFNHLGPNDVTTQQEVVHEASIALIREFLNREGCKKSLSALDEEIPRWSNSICNRVELAQTLHIAPLIRKNKNLDKPFRTIIEIVTWYLVKKPIALNDYPSRSRPGTAKTTERLSRSPGRHRFGRIGQTENNGISASRRYQRPQSSRGTRTFSPLINPATVSGLHVTNSLTKLKAKKVEDMHSASPEHVMSPREMNTNDKPAKKIKKLFKQQRLNLSKFTRKSSNPIHAKKEEEKNRPSPTEKLQKPSDTSVIVKGEGVNKQLSSPTETTNEIKKEEGVKKQPVTPTGKYHNPTIVTKRDEEIVLQDLDEHEDLIEAKCVLWLEGQDKPGYSSKPSMYVVEKEVKVEDLQALVEPKKEVVPQKPGGKSGLKVEFNLKSHSDLSWGIETAMKLKKLIFGSSSVQGFVKTWIHQAFTFREYKDERKSRLRYGIVQKKGGGPCGVLAAVQAVFLKHLLFHKIGNAGSEVSDALPTALDVSKELKTSCLAEAIIEILWRAGGGRQAVVALLSNEHSFIPTEEYKEDGITEFIYTTNCQSHESLHRTIYKNITQFETGRGGVVLLLYSAILSRGISEVMTDMDDHRGTLMAAQAYCTQEMVNLLTVGFAASNTFDNKMTKNGVVMHGIATRADVGFLSLYEHYESCTVGSNLKTPSYPIWIVCIESHFSVIFGLDRDFVNDSTEERKFDLYYYDGLVTVEQEMRITVDTSQDSHHRNPSLLELCLRTKWPKCVIDWNGSESLLQNIMMQYIHDG